MQAKVSSYEICLSEARIGNGDLQTNSQTHNSSSPLGFVRTRYLDDETEDQQNYFSPSSPKNMKVFSFNQQFQKGDKSQQRDEYKSLQKKIDKLRSENDGLRKHLYK